MWIPAIKCLCAELSWVGWLGWAPGQLPDWHMEAGRRPVHFCSVPLKVVPGNLARLSFFRPPNGSLSHFIPYGESLYT